MIDYVTLMLVNMVGALIVLGAYLVWGFGRAEQRAWAPAFGIAGLVATVCGLAMAFTWPLPSPYSMAFGEMSALLGVLFLGAAWALAAGYSLWPLGFYAFVAGASAIVIGVRIMQLSLTGSPMLSGVGFILTGLGELGAGVTLWKRQWRALRLLGAAILLTAAAIWSFTTFQGYWHHMKPPESSQSTAALRHETAVRPPAEQSIANGQSSIGPRFIPRVGL